MEHKRNASILSIVYGLMLIGLIVAAGCVTVEPMTAERAAYLAGKDATYALWRFEGVSLEDLQRAKPHIEALYNAITATTEAELDAGLSAYLAEQAKALPLASDREIVMELLNQTLAQVKLKEPALLDSRSMEIARCIVGGILDGIALAEEGAAE